MKCPGNIPHVYCWCFQSFATFHHFRTNIFTGETFLVMTLLISKWLHSTRKILSIEQMFLPMNSYWNNLQMGKLSGDIFCYPWWNSFLNISMFSNVSGFPKMAAILASFWTNSCSTQSFLSSMMIKSERLGGWRLTLQQICKQRKLYFTNRNSLINLQLQHQHYEIT